jgi:hypothetical protein
MDCLASLLSNTAQRDERASRLNAGFLEELSASRVE